MKPRGEGVRRHTTAKPQPFRSTTSHHHRNRGHECDGWGSLSAWKDCPVTICMSHLLCVIFLVTRTSTACVPWATWVYIANVERCRCILRKDARHTSWQGVALILWIVSEASSYHICFVSWHQTLRTLVLQNLSGSHNSTRFNITQRLQHVGSFSNCWSADSLNSCVTLWSDPSITIFWNILNVLRRLHTRRVTKQGKMFSARRRAQD